MSGTPKGYKETEYYFEKGVLKADYGSKKLAANIEKFFLPKKGVVDFKDEDFRMQFAKFQLGDKKPRYNLLEYQRKVFDSFGFYPKKQYESQILKFLNSEVKGWTSVSFSDGNASSYTKIPSQEVLLPKNSAKAKSLSPIKKEIALGKVPVSVKGAETLSLKGLPIEKVPKGFIRTPVYRGLKIKTESKSGAKFYSMSKEYARAYSIDNPNILDRNFSKASRDAARKVAKPVNLKKFYVPEKGFINFAKDKKLQNDFADWYVKEHLGDYSEKVLRNRALKAFSTPTGNPHWRFDDSIHKYLSERHKGWKSTMLYEDDVFTQGQLNPKNIKIKKIEGQNTIMTRDGSVAKNVTPKSVKFFDDLAHMDPPTAPVSKAAAKKSIDDFVEVWRGTVNPEKISGQYFSPAKGYAQRYANFKKGVEGYNPTVAKYYLPKDDVVDFSVNKKLQEEFAEWSGGKQLTKGLPNYEDVKDVQKFLNQKKIKWQAVKLWEGDGFDDASDISYYTKKKGLAKTVEEVVGVTSESILKSDATKNADDLVVWRGSNTKEEIPGQWFTKSEKIATEYANEKATGSTKRKVSKGKLSPTVKQYVLPEEGRVFFTDKEVRKKYDKFIWQKYFENDLQQSLKYNNPLPQIQVKRGYKNWGQVYENSFKERINDMFAKDGMGHPRYHFQDDVNEFLNKEYPGWKVTSFDEYDNLSTDKSIEGRISYRTNGDGVAQSVYADDASQASVSAVVETLETVDSSLYQGATFEQHIKNAFPRNNRQVLAALQQSVANGDDLGDAIQSVKGVLGRSGHDVKTITRSYYMDVLAKAKDYMYKVNDDLIEYVVWNSTLDSRTTPEICGVRDQKKYDNMTHDPIGHSLDWRGGPGAAHWNCRSTSYPKVKGVEAKAMNRPQIEAGPNYQAGDKWNSRGKVRKNSKDLRDKGIINVSQTTTGTTYEKYLRKQSPEFIDDVLGKQKGLAFRQGKYNLGDKTIFKVAKGSGTPPIATATSAVGKKASKKIVKPKKPNPSAAKVSKTLAGKKAPKASTVKPSNKVIIDNKSKKTPVGKNASPKVVVKNKTPKVNVSQEKLKAMSGSWKNNYAQKIPAKINRESPGKLLFERKSTIKQAEEFAKQNNFAKTVNYKGLHLDVANEINRAMTDHVNDYPEFKGMMGFLGASIEGDKIALKKLRAEFGYAVKKETLGTNLSANAFSRWAHPSIAHLDIDGIYFNSKKFSVDNYNTEIAKIANDFTSFHPKGANSVKGIMDHELGHEMDKFVGAKTNPKILELQESFMSLKAADQRATLGTYATSNEKEFIAEAWTEYRNNAAPSEYAKRVGAIINDLYKGATKP